MSLGKFQVGNYNFKFIKNRHLLDIVPEPFRMSQLEAPIELTGRPLSSESHPIAERAAAIKQR